MCTVLYDAPLHVLCIGVGRETAGPEKHPSLSSLPLTILVDGYLYLTLAGCCSTKLGIGHAHSAITTPVIWHRMETGPSKKAQGSRELSEATMLDELFPVMCQWSITKMPRGNCQFDISPNGRLPNPVGDSSYQGTIREFHIP